MRSGFNTYPPQFGGNGTSPGNFFAISSHFASSAARSATTSRWLDAHVARRLPRGRLLKYDSDSSAGNFAHRAGDADLSFQIRPVKRQRRVRIFGQLKSFAAVVIRVKNEAAFVHALEQHGAVGGPAGLVHCRQHHRVHVHRRVTEHGVPELVESDADFPPAAAC